MKGVEKVFLYVSIKQSKLEHEVGHNNRIELVVAAGIDRPAVHCKRKLFTAIHSHECLNYTTADDNKLLEKRLLTFS